MSKHYKASINPNILPIDDYTADNFEDLKDGFWVNFGLKFTNGSDGRVWIPPGQIRCIQVIED